MQPGQLNLLTECIYDAAVDPAGWGPVMQLCKEQFATGAETFYFLDYTTRSMRPVHLAGISPSFLRCFKDIFYTDDNPYTKAEPLHRPGVVRTDGRLAAYFREPEILQRSQYYNEWMRPQDFGHMMGTTLSAEDGVILNFTLLRSRERGRFGAGEVATFTVAARHLQRALRIAMRLETITARQSITEAALEHLRFGVAFLDLGGTLLHCNARADALLTRGHTLSVKDGRLVAVDPGTQRKLAALIAEIARGAGGAHAIAIPDALAARRLQLSAIRLSAARRALGRAQPVILLLISDPARQGQGRTARMRQLYALTPAEARLAEVLLTGIALRQAADLAAMTYETARWYLKMLFQKTGTRRQAELVARLGSDLAPPLTDA